MSSAAPAGGDRFGRFVISRWGLFVAFIWGVAEGSPFFVIPDIWTSLAGALAPRRSLQYLALTVAGSLLAGAGLYLWAARDPGSAGQTISAVPFVRPAMFASVRTDFGSFGAWALVRGPLSGTPYKVYAVTAPNFISISDFLLTSVPARLERLAITWALFVGVGVVLRRLTRYWRPWLYALHGAYWLVIYILYWTRT